MYISLDYTLFRSQNAVQMVRRCIVIFLMLALMHLCMQWKKGFVDIPGGDRDRVANKWCVAASIENAVAYNGNVARRAVSGVGTPKRPGGEGVEVYLFDLFDENSKSGEEYEKHFGIFGVDGFKL
ncbi:hypothetical protein LWI29_015373 [Acer saccharum]|uniref:glucan endo-1,3-beta-D-glucosidase n=1 Tax=Acer saccharum TaxID=4024 RepID=A0AA39VBT0_ACESA|nr:hypothetical protein LWI29_015373 [Acer saccharum]